ncbi:M48 family metallopeptidase [Marinobacter hydrocarbonoclasticus]|nr:M48 family metallopeptidase [Marinobacter nauticus]
MKQLAWIILCGLLAGCQMTAEERQAQVANDLTIKANTLSAELEDKGLRYPNASFNAYLESLLNGMTTEAERRDYGLKVFLAADPMVNAFALPNGHIYINAGLFDPVENEAELAFVLAHEVEHVVAQHSVKSAQQRSKTIISAHVLDLMLFGTGLGYFPMVGELSTHSQAHELEADALGYQRWRKAGYQKADINTLFSRLNNGEVPRSGSFLAYQSHPDTDDRANALAALMSAGESESEASANWQQVVDDVRLISARLKVRRHHFNRAIATADQLPETRRDLILAQAHLGLAQHPKSAAREKAWLLDEDMEDWLEHFQAKRTTHLQQSEALLMGIPEGAEDYLSAQKTLGELYRVSGDKDAAKAQFERFLALSPDGAEAFYVKGLLKTL